MATFEEEYKNLEKSILAISRFGLFPKKIDLRGAENFVTEGPNIIVGNHIGSYKDVGLLFVISPRPVFFVANKMIFKRDDFSFLVRKHLHRHLHNFGLFIHMIFNPFYKYFVDYISSNIARVGSIPVDMDGGRAEAIRKCQNYLKHGRAVVMLQGRGRLDPNEANPYIMPFRKGAAVMAYNLYANEGISVPVTPLAMLGTHIMFLIPGTIRVSVGEPMFVKDFMKRDSAETIERFRRALQARVTELFMDLIPKKTRT